MRIAYWTTSCLQPEIEAVSKEVFQLANHFPGSLLFGISPHYFMRASISGRYIGFHPGFDPILRLIIPIVERAYDINHVYGEATPWTFYKALRAKPIVLTVASEKGMPKRDFVTRCRKVLVQTSSYYQKLRASGVEQDKLELSYPGVDLHKFRPRSGSFLPHNNPKVLFATAPRSEEEMHSRGVYLLLEAAMENASIEYRLLYRKWETGYTSFATTQRWLESHLLKNVILTNSVVTDMQRVYGDHDFTVIPYNTADGGKECPTSAVEGLACGLPALVSSRSPFAEFVEEHKCGVVFDPTPSNLVGAVDKGMCQYRALSNNAINVAQQRFSMEKTLKRMAEIYEDVLRT